MIGNDEASINLNLVAGLRDFLYSQLFVSPSLPNHSFDGQTVIVTGANSGLGLEAARHFYRLKATKLILTVRCLSKGEAAKEDIMRSVTSRSDGPSVIEVWAMDASSTQSVLAFAKNAQSLPRLDVLLCNAGVRSMEYGLVEGVENNMQINVMGTFLLALSLLPKLGETKALFTESSPHLVVVSSDAHRLTRFVEIVQEDIYAAFNKKETFDGQARYQDSKLLQVLIHREIVSRLDNGEGNTPPVIFNVVNPGLCTTNLERQLERPGFATRLLHRILYRTAEVGARSLVHASYAGPATHGGYLTDLKMVHVAPWIYTEVGKNAQLKAYNQTMQILEKRGLLNVP
ncbi:hypothetical protein F5Y08DRAFT_302751 [Xylaria arbuscula]|uniref:Uncharacterized protein n=1 Tax=Xylaria arbuscula TaxID=114810 RepID=A0A9W8NNX9_9PEZI|nr:hypothetical protein F5Y08DRAFT_302751 [Xylaria arbuscula]KAJ3580175.1 hypothetical protein NPX13_g388 [Xylaria arbuscula]